jgi:hypothetical protein
MKSLKSITLITIAMMALNSTAKAGGEGEQDLTTEQFRTPSRNIYCVYNQNEDFLDCERLKPTYVHLNLNSKFTSSLNDAGDLKSSYELRSGSFELGYGDAWNAPNNKFTCTSSPTGLKCKNRANRGFFISKKSVKTF